MFCLLSANALAGGELDRFEARDHGFEGQVGCAKPRGPG
jgi:hypothetical protein